MSSSSKSIFLLVFATAVIALFFLFSGPSQTNEEDKKEIRVIIDYGNGTKRQFRGDDIKFMQDENAWSVLQRAAATASIPLEVARGFYPIVINGKRNGEEGKRWIFYVNGERKNNGAPFEVAIKEGDEVVWRFE